MLKVPLRDFQLKPSDFLDKLPIALTRYDKIICYVLTEIAENKGSINTNSLTDDKKARFQELKDKLSVNTLPPDDSIQEEIKQKQPIGKCKVPGCKDYAYGNGWHWEDGNWYQIPMCDKHAKESELAHSKADL